MRVLEIAQRICETPPAVVTANKRYVYTAMEHRGARAIIRTGADLQSGPHMQAIAAQFADLGDKVKAATKKD
jgi:hypothetical protein